jgi:hypothetical protein
MMLRHRSCTLTSTPASVQATGVRSSLSGL